MYRKTDNMMIHNRFSPFPAGFSLTLMAVALSACGGGGSSATTTTVAVIPTVATYSTLVTSVATPSYASTDNATISTLLSGVRIGSSAGLVAQSSALDVAAQNHANFLVNNSLVSDVTYLLTLFNGVLGGHYEDASKSAYTGATPQARTTAAGYGGTVSELLSFGSASASDCMAAQENSVYHLAQLISPIVDVGIAFNAGNDSGTMCVIELGLSKLTLGQLPADGSLVSYPYSTQSGVPPTFYNQSESPVPAADLSVAGHPIAVLLYSQSAPTLLGSDVVIQTFSLTPASGAQAGARILAQTGVTSTGPVLTVDTNLGGAGEVFLLPLAPLAANTVYNVAFAAIVKGKAVSKNWSFTTGAMN